MGKVTVGIGRTINTGNYESLRLYVELEDEVDLPAATQKDFDATKNQVKEFLAQLERENGVS